MSSEQRTIARLPLHIFTNLTYPYDRVKDSDDAFNSIGRIENSGDADIGMNDYGGHTEDGESLSALPLAPSELRAAICQKLKDAGRKTHSRSHPHPSHVVTNGGMDFTGTNSGLGHQDRQTVTTVGQIMRMTPPALLRALDPLLTNDECQEFIRRICKTCTPKSMTAKQILSSQLPSTSASTPTPYFSAPSSSSSSSWPLLSPFLPSGMPTLDTNLRGGFPMGSITEVVGMAGIGKTQLAMQLCVVAARYGAGSIYIDTEKKMSLQRMKEIASVRREIDNNKGREGTVVEREVGRRRGDRRNGHDGCSSSPNDDNCYKTPPVVLDNVTVHKPSSTVELHSVVARLDEEILLRNEQAAEHDAMGEDGATRRLHLPVKLIIVDSIAATARRDFGGVNTNNGRGRSSSDAPQRVKAMLQIAQMLKRVADQMQVAVVVINQIEKMNEPEQEHNSYNRATGDSNIRTKNGGELSPTSITAALGTSWHHCVSTRVALEYSKENGSGDHTNDFRLQFHTPHIEETGIRTATIVKSHMVGLSKISFEVTRSGICETDSVTRQQ